MSTGSKARATKAKAKAKASGRVRLASPTMAQIYMRQGHFHRARETLDAVLDGDPTAGAAHVLLARLALLDGPTISGRITGEGARLDIRWKGAPSDAHVIVILYRGRDVFVTSRRCDGENGRWQLDFDGADRSALPSSARRGRLEPSAAAISLVRPGRAGRAGRAGPAGPAGAGQPELDELDKTGDARGSSAPIPLAVAEPLTWG